jgi:hypothetical protein
LPFLQLLLHLCQLLLQPIAAGPQRLRFRPGGIELLTQLPTLRFQALLRLRIRGLRRAQLLLHLSQLQLQLIPARPHGLDRAFRLVQLGPYLLDLRAQLGDLCVGLLELSGGIRVGGSRGGCHDGLLSWLCLLLRTRCRGNHYGQQQQDRQVSPGLGNSGTVVESVACAHIPGLLGGDY